MPLEYADALRLVGVDYPPPYRRPYNDKRERHIPFPLFQNQCSLHPCQIICTSQRATHHRSRPQRGNCIQPAACTQRSGSKRARRRVCSRRAPGSRQAHRQVCSRRARRPEPRPLPACSKRARSRQGHKAGTRWRRRRPASRPATRSVQTSS